MSFSYGEIIVRVGNNETSGLPTNCDHYILFIMNYGNYSTRKKRKRILLTVEEKLKIIERVEQGEDAMKLADEYNVGKTTIRDILNKKNEYLYFALNSDSYSCVRNRKTLKKSMNPELDRAVFEWFQEKRVRGESVTRQALVEAAQRLHKHMGFAEPFLASKGWLHGFKGRHGIENLEIPGEKLLTAVRKYNVYLLLFIIDLAVGFISVFF